MKLPGTPPLAQWEWAGVFAIGTAINFGKWMGDADAGWFMFSVLFLVICVGRTLDRKVR